MGISCYIHNDVGKDRNEIFDTWNGLQTPESPGTLEFASYAIQYRIKPKASNQSISRCAGVLDLGKSTDPPLKTLMWVTPTTCHSVRIGKPCPSRPWPPPTLGIDENPSTGSEKNRLCESGIIIPNASPTSWFVEKRKQGTGYFGRRISLLNYQFGVMWLEFNSRRCICPDPLFYCAIKATRVLKKRISSLLHGVSKSLSYNIYICIHIHIYIYISTKIMMLSRPHNHQLSLHGLSICDSKATHKLGLDADLQKTTRGNWEDKAWGVSKKLSRTAWMMIYDDNWW